MAKENQNEVARKLLQKFLQYDCTPEEKQRVLNWFYSFEENKEEADRELNNKNIAAEVNKNLNNRLFVKEHTKKHWWQMKITYVAASLIGIIAGGVIWYHISFLPNTAWNENIKYKEKQSITIRDADVQPGTRNAKIYYPDGNSKILSDSCHIESFDMLCKGKGDIRLEVPLASEFKLILEDGTQVWLNSSTVLVYPSHFEQNERYVKLNGEAYFNVAKDINRPFRIDANGTQIEVLGTEFNVNAYKKDVQTTLVEGSVKIKKESIQKVLTPGQEALVSEHEITINEIDTESVTAWQRGEFYFDGQNLGEVLDQIARWYNVEYNIENIKDMKTAFKGSISRNKNLSSILEILTMATGKTFRLKGREIII